MPRFVDGNFCVPVAEGNWCLYWSYLCSTMTHTLHGTLTSQFQSFSMSPFTKPSVIASFLCETTNFCVPF